MCFWHAGCFLLSEKLFRYNSTTPQRIKIFYGWQGPLHYMFMNIVLRPQVHRFKKCGRWITLTQIHSRNTAKKTFTDLSLTQTCSLEPSHVIFRPLLLSWCKQLRDKWRSVVIWMEPLKISLIPLKHEKFCVFLHIKIFRGIMTSLDDQRFPLGQRQLVKRCLICALGAAWSRWLPGVFCPSYTIHKHDMGMKYIHDKIRWVNSDLGWLRQI